MNKGTKDFLDLMKKRNSMINALRQQIEIERSMLTDTSIHYKEVSICAGGTAYDAIGNKAPEIVELRKELERYIEELAWMKRSALKTLRQCKPDYQVAIMYYYMQDNTLEVAADKMHISYQWFCHILKDAEKEFDEKRKTIDTN